MSKTALIGLTKALSQNLVDEHIRVNCIAPGVVETKSSEIVSLMHNLYEVIIVRILFNCRS